MLFVFIYIKDKNDKTDALTDDKNEKYDNDKKKWQWQTDSWYQWQR